MAAKFANQLFEDLTLLPALGDFLSFKRPVTYVRSAAGSSSPDPEDNRTPIHPLTKVWLELGSDDARSDKIENALVWKADIAEFSLAWREEISGRFDETGSSSPSQGTFSDGLFGRCRVRRRLNHQVSYHSGSIVRAAHTGETHPVSGQVSARIG